MFDCDTEFSWDLWRAGLKHISRFVSHRFVSRESVNVEMWISVANVKKTISLSRCTWLQQYSAWCLYILFYYYILTLGNTYIGYFNLFRRWTSNEWSRTTEKKHCNKYSMSIILYSLHTIEQNIWHNIIYFLFLAEP